MPAQASEAGRLALVAGLTTSLIARTFLEILVIWSPIPILRLPSLMTHFLSSSKSRSRSW
ncbi:hypothetical protein BDV24DRAFT_127125 [Aspergillus arachidicola]|uniref:Uncharacterized protein n=1 Tax=Aspergillus arachidicola TaxID=656916 RepID=A0A5N6YIU1_9EURO|nr:hypothetical protein BDV24DRAFT_127125 [Aspergillus arachidicola]